MHLDQQLYDGFHDVEPLPVDPDERRHVPHVEVSVLVDQLIEDAVMITSRSRFRQHQHDPMEPGLGLALNINLNIHSKRAVLFSCVMDELRGVFSMVPWRFARSGQVTVTRYFLLVRVDYRQQGRFADSRNNRTRKSSQRCECGYIYNILRVCIQAAFQQFLARHNLLCHALYACQLRESIDR